MIWLWIGLIVILLIGCASGAAEANGVEGFEDSNDSGYP